MRLDEAVNPWKIDHRTPGGADRHRRGLLDQHKVPDEEPTGQAKINLRIGNGGIRDLGGVNRTIFDFRVFDSAVHDLCRGNRRVMYNSCRLWSFKNLFIKIAEHPAMIAKKIPAFIRSYTTASTTATSESRHTAVIQPNCMLAFDTSRFAISCPRFSCLLFARISSLFMMMPPSAKFSLQNVEMHHR